MPQQHVRTNRFSPEITDEEIAQIVADRLPQWKAACDNPSGDIVIIQQEVFRRSVEDMLLLHAAIRYAGNACKTVMIAPDED